MSETKSILTFLFRKNPKEYEEVYLKETGKQEQSLSRKEARAKLQKEKFSDCYWMALP